jgi:hypothetical protein
MDDELSAALGSEAGLQAGADGCVAGGNPLVPELIEGLDVFERREVDDDFEQVGAF